MIIDDMEINKIENIFPKKKNQVSKTKVNFHFRINNQIIYQKKKKTWRFL